MLRSDKLVTLCLPNGYRRSIATWALACLRGTSYRSTTVAYVELLVAPGSLPPARVADQRPELPNWLRGLDSVARSTWLRAQARAGLLRSWTGAAGEVATALVDLFGRVGPELGVEPDDVDWWRLLDALLLIGLHSNRNTGTAP